MTWFDYAVFAVVGLSVLLAAFRGMVREMAALAGWVAAPIVPRLFAQQLAQWLSAPPKDLTRRIRYR